MPDDSLGEAPAVEEADEVTEAVESPADNDARGIAPSSPQVVRIGAHDLADNARRVRSIAALARVLNQDGQGNPIQQFLREHRGEMVHVHGDPEEGTRVETRQIVLARRGAEMRREEVSARPGTEEMQHLVDGCRIKQRKDRYLIPDLTDDDIDLLETVAGHLEELDGRSKVNIKAFVQEKAINLSNW